MLRPYAREIPYDFSTQVENLIDPAHAPFSHHGYLGNRDKVGYGQFEMKAVPDPDSLMVELKSDRGTSSLTFMPPTRVNYLRRPEVNKSSYKLLF